MKKQTALFLLLIYFIYPAFSQSNDSVYLCKQTTIIYKSCSKGTMEEIYMQGDSVTITNQVCNDNEPLSKMIRVKLFKQSMTGKYEGWALYNELIKKSEFKEYRIQQDIRDKKANKYGDSIKALKQKTKYSRPLWVLSVTADDYTDQSMGITVTFLNTSKKIIKYINFTVVPYNQVDDPVIDDMGVSTKACQLIGPIEPDETVSYQKDILFFSSVISYSSFASIKRAKN